MRWAGRVAHEISKGYKIVVRTFMGRGMDARVMKE
jgi:hypothetical protein